MTEFVLIRRWQTGEADAFDEIYQHHAPAIYRLGWAMLRDGIAAEDVVQETFIRAHQARQRFDPKRARLSTWLYQIALNYCRSYLRRKRLRTIPWTWLQGPRPGTQPLPAVAGPEIRLLQDEYRRVLWEAVQTLSAPLKEVITLHYYLEIPAVEVATIVECPVGTVYSRLHNARRQLRQALVERGFSAVETFEAQNAH